MGLTRVALVLMASLVIERGARADARADVEAAVRAHLKTFGAAETAATNESVTRGGADPITGLAPTALVYLNKDTAKADEPFNFGVDLTGNFSGSASIKIEKMTVVVADGGHAAWFHVRGTLKYKEVVGEGIDDWAKPLPVRVSGALVDDHGWKIVRVAYTAPIEDKEMIASAGYHDPPLSPASGAPAHTGDAAIGKAVDAWFPGGLVAAAGAQTIVANGTAPGERGDDRAAALKLAKAWDKLKLGATEVDAVAFGKLGFVRVVVRLPVKPAKGKTPIAAEMVLHAVVADEGGTWRWQSLNWGGRNP